MPDITMCVNKECPVRERCYRAMAIPSDWQSMACFKYEVGKTYCDHFVPAESYPKEMLNV